jgi:small subunit ribosomal protein S3
MGQKVSPIGFRTGITRDWQSRWFAPKSNYGEFLVEDEKVRRFIDANLNHQPPYAAIASVEIERTREEVKVILRTARPGLVIGPKGVEVDRLKAALEKLTDRRVNVNIVEIRNPDLNAQLVASGIAEQLRRRASFRRTIKTRCETTMGAGAKGVKVQVSGRLGGAEMSRTEKQHLGSIPLQTLDADVDYGCIHAMTTYGVIGVKVWIYRGMKGSTISDEVASAMGPGVRRRPQGPGGGGGGGRGGRSGGPGGPGRGGPGRGGPGRGGPGRGAPGRGRIGGDARPAPSEGTDSAGEAPAAPGEGAE